MDLLPENRPKVEAHLRAQGWLAPEEPLLSLAPAGDGNMNRTLRAETPVRTFILKQAVPFVARYPDIAAPASRLEVESAFYASVSSCPALAMRTPRILGEDRSNHLLCMTDLGPGPDLSSLYRDESKSTVRTGSNGAQLTAVVYWLWKLHAHGIGIGIGIGGSTQAATTSVPENREMRELNHAHIFGIPLQVNNGVELSSALQQIQRAYAKDSELKERARALGALYLGEADHASATTLLHGNYYPGSWLKHESMGVMIIDPEFAFPGPPEFDVGVLMAHLTMAGLAQAEVMMLMRSYVTPPGFSYPLALAFAGIEIIRRLLGAAQLPLKADEDTKSRWLQTARSMVTA